MPVHKLVNWLISCVGLLLSSILLFEYLIELEYSTEYPIRKPYDTSKLHVSFRFCDLGLDPLSFIYELYRLPSCKYELLTSRLQNLIVPETKCVHRPYSYRRVNGSKVKPINIW